MPDETASRPSLPRGFVRSDEDLDAAVVLSTLVWMTPRRRIEIGARAGSAAGALAAIADGREGAPSDAEHVRDVDPRVVRGRAEAFGARLVPFGSPEYPEQLAQIADPPMLLFVVGRAPPDLTRCVAIVGSRRPSDLGAEVARALGRGLARAGVTVVSGAARGIDSAAHLGALDDGGGTVAVLGCGIDRPYPSRAFLERLRRGGTLVSEFPPGTPPHPKHFPSRNRIVAGLSRATVVVEGAEGSGSMITAEHAMEFGRDVFAVAGAVTNPLAAVPLRLIREGAGAIRGVEDLLEDLGLDGARVDASAPPDLDDDERRILRALRGPTLPERAAGELGVTVVQVMPALMRLELRGLVRSVGGRYEPTLRASAFALDASDRGTGVNGGDGAGRAARHRG